jgi:ABC-type branched-subunit amino acid transport system substrate-binding protein
VDGNGWGKLVWAHVGRLGLATSLLSAVASGCASPSDPEATVKLGVLLPYTGEASALSANLEKGSLLAAAEMNAVGGVGGMSVEVLFGNTFSDPLRAEQQARTLIDQGVVAIIGPGEDQVAPSLFQLLADAGVLLFSPLVSAGAEGIGTSEAPWFRMAPTTRVLGQNLAKVVGDLGTDQIGTVVASDSYHSELADAFAERVASYAEIELSLTIDESDFDVDGLTRQISERLDAGMTGVMLAMHPRPAARLATELAALRGDVAPPQWFLTPRLKTELLLQNASPGVWRGAVGIAPEVFADTRREFETRFARRFDDLPFDSTFYFYDATAVVLIALDRSLARGQTLPNGITAAIEEVASFGGVRVDWSHCGRARELNQSGSKLQYVGLTGPVILNEDGSRSLGTSSLWGVEDGAIVER